MLRLRINDVYCVNKHLPRAKGSKQGDVYKTWVESSGCIGPKQSEAPLFTTNLFYKYTVSNFEAHRNDVTGGVAPV